MNRTTLDINGTRRTFFATADGYIFESVANGSCPVLGMWPHQCNTITQAVRELIKLPECGSCRRSGIYGNRADGLFRGVTYGVSPRTGKEKDAPYKGYLCLDHVEVQSCNGEIALVESIDQIIARKNAHIAKIAARVNHNPVVIQ